MSNLKNFSAEEVKGHISGKFELYDSAIRNGYYLPKYKSGIITENYLTNVILGEIFCPKFSDIKLLPCPSPPDKETLIKWVNNIKSPTGKTFGIGYDDHTPNKDWLVVILSTYRSDLKIFKKDYVAPPVRKRMRDIETIVLPDELFADMPKSTSKLKARRLKVVGQAFEAEKVNRLKETQKHFYEEIITHE
jgi:hypothetical protein